MSRYNSNSYIGISGLSAVIDGHALTLSISYRKSNSGSKYNGNDRSVYGYLEKFLIRLVLCLQCLYQGKQPQKQDLPRYDCN